MTKLIAFSALSAAVYAAVRAKRRAAAKNLDSQDISAFDYADLEAPIVVTEEIIVITETDPYDIDMEMIPADEQSEARNENPNDPDLSSFEMPGRDAGPR